MLLAKNKKALFNNEIIEKYIAGIVLTGYEVKAIREGNVNFEGAYVTILDSEPYVVGLTVGKYSKQSQDTSAQEAKKSRKLLLKSAEITKIQKELAEKGKSAIPLALILQNNLIKLELATVKGRKKHEKKQLLKDRQVVIDLAKSRKTEGVYY